ncbi:MAG: PP2C family protein-serine/threonine phosphatase [Sporichthyaceae bacterium]
MTASFDPLDRPVGRLLRLAQAADPQQVVETLSMTVAELGGSDVVLFLVDYDHSRLTPHPDVLPHGEQPTVVSLEGSMAGRVFVSGEPLGAQREDGWHVWVPVAERAQKLGVLSMTLPTWDDQVRDLCVELGIAAAHLVSTANGYTDRLHLLRRRKEMSLDAEIQWGVLPPLTFSIDGTTVAGMLEPAYEVGGDCFDYSLNGDVLDVAIFDAMGHGLRSAALGSLAVSAYRNTRRNRRPADLPTLLFEVDAVISAYAREEAFVTGLFMQLDITTGHLQWVTGGHPAPLHVRRANTLPPVAVRPSAPLGLNAWLEAATDVDVIETSLEPGDALLLYTDGVVDARDREGEEFGEDRLIDLLERESTSGREPAEVLRRLVQSVLTYNGAPLRDDASTLYLRWDSAAASRR